ncbi:hypothetical protein EDB85DRAFT_1999557 [Lactarius pseudohatsudake]|nr:hypothetical protein EDB85DRAFT_1999557 [Lactarius pseudohatsudake]
MRRLTASPRKDPPGRHTIQVEPANPLSLSGAYLLKKKRGTDAGRAFGLESKIAPPWDLQRRDDESYTVSDLRALQGVVDVRFGRTIPFSDRTHRKAGFRAQATMPCAHDEDPVRGVENGVRRPGPVRECQWAVRYVMQKWPGGGRGGREVRRRTVIGAEAVEEGGARAELTVRGNGGKHGKRDDDQEIAQNEVSLDCGERTWVPYRYANATLKPYSEKSYLRMSETVGTRGGTDRC